MPGERFLAGGRRGAASDGVGEGGAAGIERRCEDGEHQQPADAPAQDPTGPAANQAGGTLPAAIARRLCVDLRAERPERRPAEEDQGGGQEGERGDQGQDDADRGDRAEAAVVRKVRQEQAEHAQDDGDPRREDRCPGAAQCHPHGAEPGRLAVQLLAEAGDQQQAVVGGAPTTRIAAMPWLWPLTAIQPCRANA